MIPDFCLQITFLPSLALIIPITDSNKSNSQVYNGCLLKNNIVPLSFANHCILIYIYFTISGAAAVVGSTLLEMGLSQGAINEIKRVLKKDIELTKPLRNWIQFSHEIDHRFNQLFQCDIVSDTFHSVMKVYRQCIKLLDSGSRSVEDIIRSLQFCKIEGIEDLTMEIADKVIHFFQGMLRNPELLQPMKEICTILQENPYTLELAKTGVIIYSKIIGSLQSESINMILSVTGLSLPNLGGSVLGRCVLDAISLASHVVTIIISVKNIQEGQSKYSEALDRVKFALLSELREVNKQMGKRVQYLEMDYGDSFELCNAKLAIR